MNILVTGGGGFLGSHVARRLRARGDQVRVLGRHRYPALTAAGIECCQGSILTPGVARRACEGMDAVVHAAAVAGVWGARRLFWQTNHVGTEVLLAECRAAGCRRFVYTSSPSVVFGRDAICGGDETLPYPARYLAHYPASKAAAERVVLAANGPDLLTCAIRPHLIWGPGDPHLIPRLLAAARAGQLRQVGDGSNLVDITYIDNAAQAHVQALDRLCPGSPVCGQPYFIGDAQPVRLWDWIRELLRRHGLPPPGRPISYRTAYALGALLETVYRVLPLPGEPRLTRFVAAQFALSHWFSHAKAERDFGYRPETDNETGLRLLLAADR